MKFSYFPGCSLKGTGKAYEESLLPVLQALDIQLEELDDWNCCGATAYMAVDEAKACILASRNLAIAEKMGHQELMAPCSACYLVLNKTKKYLKESPAVHRVVQKALGSAGLTYSGNVPIRHPLDILVNTIGLDAIKKRVKRPLKGLKVAPYYGCQIVRPYATFDSAENPTTMDRLLEALGASVVRFPLKTRCCGASLTGTLPEPGLLCSYIILKEALKRGADVIATVCPLCQFNLDGYHDKIAAKWEPVRIPTVYFSQLMGLAFGIPAEQLGLHRCIVPMKPLPELPAAAAPKAPAVAA
ncbi:CoB--CoM heterodisulfide reductase iron-sulfur subunit B family protein [Fontisphaera persica]|uniref:CoB--CoM heterodisulfide reductase iron-sulfur subunit B family protein n=1 Tax=Fontisphaera persica TaxID=2974023 RepID=UPI0024C056FE|nr:CoB--CoM heterodisulfide reductase iron-sulfur subunit B family protein [Fontisphaera persica]WCJ60045.1 CoB--CoM heterodisulfide reductase iron-sulfur subunit B family protein [Fontisphaera persica]